MNTIPSLWGFMLKCQPVMARTRILNAFEQAEGCYVRTAEVLEINTSTLAHMIELLEESGTKVVAKLDRIRAAISRRQGKAVH